MMWLAMGVVLGFLLGSLGAHIRLQSIYIRHLEHIANLAALMQETRGRQNQELAQLKLAVMGLHQSVAALRSRGRQDLN